MARASALSSAATWRTTGTVHLPSTMVQYRNSTCESERLPRTRSLGESTVLVNRAAYS